MSKKNKAVFFIISSAFCFSLMNTFVKLAGDLPSIQKSFFRNLIALIVAFFILSKSSEGFSFKRENLKYLILRSFVGTIGILGNFYAVDHLLLSDASMISKLSPFLVLVFSATFLKEQIKPYQLISVAVAFFGSLFIIRPGFSSDTFPAIIGFIGAMGAAAAYTTVRYLGTKGERGPVIVLFFSAFSCLVTLPFILLDFHSMNMLQLLYLIMAGVCASGGQFSVTAAYSNAPAREISVYDYSQIIFAALTGFIVFDQIPDIYSIIGYIIICGISIFMFLKNKASN